MCRFVVHPAPRTCMGFVVLLLLLYVEWTESSMMGGACALTARHTGRKLARPAGVRGSLYVTWGGGAGGGIKLTEPADHLADGHG